MPRRKSVCYVAMGKQNPIHDHATWHDLSKASKIFECEAKRATINRQETSVVPTHVGRHLFKKPRWAYPPRYVVVSTSKLLTLLQSCVVTRPFHLARAIQSLVLLSSKIFNLILKISLLLHSTTQLPL